MPKDDQNIWDERYLELVNLAATWSEDKSRGVGAVIVGPANDIRSVGYNTMPRGINKDKEERHSKLNGQKYYWFEHAERNAIYNAARSGMMTYDCIMYSSVFPCSSCMRAIIQSGIKQIITTQPDFDDANYGDSFKAAREMAEEAQVVLKYLTN